MFSSNDNHLRWRISKPWWEVPKPSEGSMPSEVSKLWWKVQKPWWEGSKLWWEVSKPKSVFDKGLQKPDICHIFQRRPTWPLLHVTFKVTRFDHLYPNVWNHPEHDLKWLNRFGRLLWFLDVFQPHVKTRGSHHPADFCLTSTGYQLFNRLWDFSSFCMALHRSAIQEGDESIFVCVFRIFLYKNNL